MDPQRQVLRDLLRTHKAATAAPTSKRPRQEFRNAQASARRAGRGSGRYTPPKDR